MMEKNPPHILRCCIWFARPVKPPVSVLHLVVFRVITSLLVAFTMIGSIMLHILFPWKIEIFEERSLQFGLWKICKFTPQELPYYECFTEFYHNEEVENWFYAWQYLLALSTCLLVLAFCCVIISITFRGRNTKNAWVFTAYCCLISGCLKFCCQIIFYIKFEFGFAEGARMVLGWTEETEIEELFGSLYSYTWFLSVLLWVISYLCYYTKHVEKGFFLKNSHNSYSSTANEQNLDKQPFKNDQF